MRIGEYLELPKIMTFSRDEEITEKVVADFIKQHQAELPRYKKLGDMYKGNMDIFDLQNKEAHKPDIRLAVGMPRFIVDTFTGYFNGIPIKKTHPTKSIAEKIEQFESDNSIEDKEHEIAKISCVYGRCYELIYQNEDTETKTAYVSPETAFIVYDDTVERKKLFGVSYSIKSDGKVKGTLYTESSEFKISSDGSVSDLKFGDEFVNPFQELNIHEFYLNEERMGLFEQSKTMIDNFNKALSEKANDVDYFSDSYLKMLGLPIDETGMKNIRENRVISASGDNSEKAVVEFVDKPDSDQSTENLLDRLERLIYQMSMVANLSDENFGQASGTALAYKLQAMSNLALSFQRKFENSLRERYKLFFSIETNFSNAERDEWKQMEYLFNRNQPNNLKEEAETASMLMGITSDETALSVLSKVPDVRAEMKRIEEQDKSRQDDFGFNEVVDTHGEE